MFKTWSKSSRIVLILSLLDLIGLALCVLTIFGTTSADIHGSIGIAADPNGNVYVSGTTCIKKYSPDLKFTGTWGACDSSFYLSPRRLAITPQGEFYGLAYPTARDYDKLNVPPNVQKLDASGKVIATWGTEGTEEQRLDKPFNIAVDTAGMVYVMDQGSNNGQRILEFDSNGRFMGRWLSQDPAYQERAKVFELSDAAGNVYRANLDSVQQTDSTGYKYYAQNNFIEKKDPAGKVLAEWTPKTKEYPGLLKTITVTRQDKIYAFLENSPPPFPSFLIAYDTNGNQIGYLFYQVESTVLLGLAGILAGGFFLFVLLILLIVFRGNDKTRQRQYYYYYHMP